MAYWSLALPLLFAQPAADTANAPVPPPADTPPTEDGASDEAPPAVGGDETAPENIIGRPGSDDEPDAVEDELIDGRRRPGVQAELPEAVTQDNPGAVRAPPPEAFPAEQIAIPDRWRLIQTLGLVTENFWDPYHQNTYKGDRPINKAKVPWLPIKGEDWFFVLNAVSDTVIEPRSLPLPVGIQYPARPGSNDVFGRPTSLIASQTFLVGAALIKGYTAYKPPDVEWRVTLAYNMNYVEVPEKRILYVKPTKGRTRFDQFLGVQEAFLDYHVRNTSDRYDFESLRVGIQPFQADFRGFLFNDNQLSFRYFGNRDNNRFQYNLYLAWRLEKDTNSGLNSIVQAPRQDYVFIGNIYRQDFPFVGMTSELIAAININREANETKSDDNGFPVRPALIGNLQGRDYDVAYLGYGVDGRLGRLNLTAFGYAALGEDRDNVFTGRPADIRAFFGAAELSYDRNWVRFRLSGLYASGDDDPFDDTENGFDAIFENPVFAGADTSYWIRQPVPFIGGGRAVGINGRNGILNDLRSSKEQGQSNFINPGTILVGAGADFDLTPTLRIATNANHLWFENTAVLQTLRSEGSIPKEIGWDLSAAATWRPKANQNIVFRLSGAVLVPGDGFNDLFTNFDGNENYYSILGNIVLTY
ncbi:hypothetical protein [Novosphingobium aquimarinum]|uniref:hypothetical protein n=1 Tax=Novosphingobium aquimarinum TaxID=2682494 RepID=UPI001E52F5DC|nr:hypothetical protein [Novosphingobium aquimarinum]